MNEVVVILDNVRSAHNVGAIFRTADAAGVKKLYLTGITPTPTDRFGRPQPEIEKTSLGATKFLPWEHIGDSTTLSTTELVTLIKNLQKENFTVVAVEQSPNATSLHDFTAGDKVAYIFGAEVEGVQPEVLQAVDTTLEIPMQGQKESLNVSVTAGIVLFNNLRR